MPSINRLEVQLKNYIKDMIYAESLIARLSILIIATIVLFIRRTDSFINPQFWAEDGPVFFLQQYENGLSTITQPYAGYLHLIPRLIAFISELFFPYSLVPFVYTFMSFVITLFVINAIFSRRLNIKYKGLFSLALVLIPHYGNEVFMNVTNIQWILCVLLVTTAMKEEPNYVYGNLKTQYVFDIITTTLCGLTGPFLIFIMPLFAWKWFQNKNKYNSIIIFAVGIILIVQLSLIPFETVELRSSYINLDLNAYGQIIGTKIFGGLFLGRLANSISPFLLSAVYFSLVVTLVLHSPHKRKFIIFFLYIHLVILLAVFYKFKATPEILIPPENGTRYFYLPYIMIVWSLVIALEEIKNWKKALILIALLCVFFSALTSNFRSSYIDFNWLFYSKNIGKEDIVIPINPKGWQIYVKARK
jgi:hypothetical protein